jgi:hypothetical protein
MDINTYASSKESPINILNKVDSGDIGWNEVAQERTVCCSGNCKLFSAKQETVFVV